MKCNSNNVSYAKRVLLCCALLIMCCACSSKKDSAPQTAQSADTNASQKVSGKVPSAQRYLNFNVWNEPEYIDPGLLGGAYASIIGRNIFEGLYQANPETAAAEPALALGYTLSKDAKTYTFTLRKDAKWSDGKPVTAHDFVYAWERVLNPNTAAHYAFFMHYVKNARAYNLGESTDASTLGFRATDDHTLVVELENPTPFFLDLLCYPTYYPVPKWTIEAHGNKWTHDANIVTNGPFHVTKWVQNKELVASKSPTYWDAENVKIAGIRFLPIEDKETALKMYYAGEIDINWQLPSMKIPALMKRDDYVNHAWISTYYYRLNTRKAPLNDERVRQALAYAIDRETLVNKYLQKTVIPWSSMTPAGLEGYDVPPGLAFDPARAKALLTEAGYGEGGKAFPTLSLLYNTDDRHKLIAQIVQQMWSEHLGITVQLHNQEWKSYLKAMKTGDYDIARSGWIGDYGDPNTFLEYFKTESGHNWTGWSNPEYDGLIFKAAEQDNPAERMQTLAAAERIILDESPTVPVYNDVKHMLVSPEVRGFYGNIQDIHAMKSVYFVE